MARDRSSDNPRKVPLQDTLRLSGRGAGMLLGELEHALMEAAWTLGRPATARELYGRIVKSRPIEQITAVTVLNRLVAPKRLMKREKVDDVFNYQPTLTREEFLQRASRHVAERVLALGTEAVTASIVDVLADRDPEQLQELGRLVRRKLRERDERRSPKESKE
jgi:predicted transcriptional regulator